MKVSFFLKEPEKKAPTPVFARITWDNNTLKFYRGYKIDPEFWDQRKQQANKTNKFPENPQFNRDIASDIAKISKVYDDFKTANDKREPTPAELKPLVDAVLNPQKHIEKNVTSFIQYFDDFRKRSIDGSRIKKGRNAKATVYNTNKGYLTTYTHLKNFETERKFKLDFEKIDLVFYNDFTAYLSGTLKLANSTVGSHIKNIKTVLHEATANGIKTNPAFQSPYFTKLTEETDSIYLTQAELDAIEQIDLSDNKRLDGVRDLFVIGCYTGQRFSDWGSITPGNISDGLISITQVKTEEKVQLPIHDVVKRIFKKYDGNLPRPLSNQKMNDYIKEVAEKVPALKTKEQKTITKAGKKVTTIYEKWQLCTTHTARRTMATLSYKEGMPIVSIMAVTGHKSMKSFMSYIKLTSAEHAHIVAMHWQKQKEKKEAEKETEQGKLRAV